MKNYEFELKSDVSKSFMCQKAANSLDIDVDKKSIHKFKIQADLDTDFKIGLIIGASGSGKTTFAKNVFGNDCFNNNIDEKKCVLDQFDEKYTYEQRAEILNSIGLTSVPCWIRPVNTLSNGQKTRAEIALTIASNKKLTIIDEWTSVVDRTVAKVMSHCVQKNYDKNGKQIILLSCHYDVVEWLNPCWIIDCNKQTFEDRRSLRQEFKRTNKIKFDVKQTNGSEWKYFSKYHYLSEKLPVGKLYHYGLFHNDNQVGYVCFANYVPKLPHKKIAYHFNRLVIHPDYVGFGLGIKFLNHVVVDLKEKINCDIYGAFSSTPVLKALSKDKKWKLINIRKNLKSNNTGNSANKTYMRLKVTMFSFKYTG